MSVTEYVTNSLKYLDEEEQRNLFIINRCFHKKIEKINLENFITSKTKDMAKKDTGITFMLNNKKKTRAKRYL